MAYIFDIDGTLADCSHRLRFILPREKDLTGDIDLDKIAPDWDTFHKECINDKPIAPVVKLASILIDAGECVLFVTGRPKQSCKDTVDWLCNNLGIETVVLFMREDGDHRQDAAVKKEIYKNYIEPYYLIDGVFEDRKQCVDMWRSLGLTCYQVAEGNY